MIEANRREELVATVKDWRYLAKKTLLRKSQSVEKDLSKAQAVAPSDDSLRTLVRSFANSGHLFNHCRTQKDIESTLMARLRHSPDLRAAIEELAQMLKTPLIAPVHLLPDRPHPALLRTLEGHSSSVWGCAFSPDSKRIVSASDDRILKVWDADSGECLATFFCRWAVVLLRDARRFDRRGRRAGRLLFEAGRVIACLCVEVFLLV
ncbi:MAG: hypothetical protein JST85_14310 [Acidobacteria bacterium]|nr:hypothetical protein [Acidobacteriota bacterium]